MGICSDTSTLSALAFVLFFLFLGQPAQACDFPDPIKIPNGKQATKLEMAAAGMAIETYITEMQAYAECVELETEVLRRSASKEDISGARHREELAAKRQNKAAAAIEDAAEKFNRAVDDYKSRALK